MVEVGSVVMCLRRIEFVTGARHHMGQFIEVREEELPYFQAFTNGKDYVLHSSPQKET
jgi:hypothetical protein